MTKINNQQGFAHVLGLGLGVLVIAGIGFTGYTVMNAQDKKQLNSSDQVVDVKEALPLTLEGLMKVSQIKELAVQTSSATVAGVELENENGLLVYEIMLSDGTVIVFNAITGEKLKTSVGPVIIDADESDSLPADFNVKVSFEEARAAAQAKFPQGTINKIELDVEDGVVVISVRFTDKARVDVDAISGEVVRTKSPKGVESSKTKINDGGNDATKSDEQDAPDAPDTDEDRDIEADDVDEAETPDQPDQPDVPEIESESDSSGSGNGSSGRRG